MEIQIDSHTLERARERGADESEIREVILRGVSGAARKSRKMKSKVFQYGGIRQGKFYDQKKLEVYYVEEPNKIITVTVYVFYGKWEE